MDFALTDDQLAIRAAVEKICRPFMPEYWLERDRTGEFAHDFHKAFADAGWFGIAMPQEYCGAGLGIAEAAITMETISGSGASTVHFNI